MAGSRALPELADTISNLCAVCSFQPVDGQATLELPLGEVLAGKDIPVLRALHSDKVGLRILKMAQEANMELQAKLDATAQASLCLESYRKFVASEVFRQYKDDALSKEQEKDFLDLLDMVEQDSKKFVFAVMPPFTDKVVSEVVDSFLGMVGEVLTAARQSLIKTLKQSFSQLKEGKLDLKMEAWCANEGLQVRVMALFTSSVGGNVDAHGGANAMLSKISDERNFDPKFKALLESVTSLLQIVPGSEAQVALSSLGCGVWISRCQLPKSVLLPFRVAVYI